MKGFNNFLSRRKKILKEKYDNALERIRYPRATFVEVLNAFFKLLLSLVTTKVIFTTVLALLTVFIINNTMPDNSNDIRSIVNTASLLFLIFIVYIFIKFFTKNTRVNNDLEFSFSHIYKVDSGLFNVDVKNVNTAKFKIAEKHDAPIAAIINMKTFAGGIWETSYYDKYIRNKGHIKKNRLSIVLIRSEKTDEFIGFTHVLPVNERVWNIYTSGKIKDNKFDQCYILPENIEDKPYEDVYGLIFFSAGIPIDDDDFEHNDETRTDMYYRYLGELLEQSTAYHLNLFLESMFKNRKTVKVLFTNFDDYFLKPFEKEAINGKMFSKDKAPIFIFEITNKVA